MPHSRARRISIRVLTGTRLPSPYHRPMSRRILALVLIGMISVACSGGSDLEATPTDLAALSAATAIDVTDGEPTAVWFTTPWCRRCDEQLRDVLTTAADHCDVRLVIVVGRAGEGAIGQFLAANEGAGPCAANPPTIVVDGDGAGFGAVPVITAPTWLFVGADGVAVVERAPVGIDDLRRRLSDLVA